MSNKITIAATVNAGIKKVWNYYTNPEHITKWNFAHPSWHCPSASNDLRMGGKYSAQMEAKDGNFGFEFEAVYNEITNGKKFTYTMPDGMEVTVIFNGNDMQTVVTVTFDPETQNSLDAKKWVTSNT